MYLACRLILPVDGCLDAIDSNGRLKTGSLEIYLGKHKRVQACSRHRLGKDNIFGRIASQTYRLERARPTFAAPGVTYSLAPEIPGSFGEP